MRPLFSCPFPTKDNPIKTRYPLTDNNVKPEQFNIKGQAEFVVDYVSNTHRAGK